MDPKNDLHALRSAVNATQADFASHMGVPLRTFEDLETGRSTLRDIHIRAAEMAAMQLAVDRLSASTLPHKLQQIAKDLAGQIG